MQNLRPSIKAILIDVSGNLHVGSRPTPNAVEAFARLREAGIPFRLCSNTSKESTESLRDRLRKLGFDVMKTKDCAKQELWTSIGSVKTVLREKNLRRPYYLLSDSAKDEIQAFIDAQFPNDTSEECDSVIVGLAPELLNYGHLNTAFRILVGEEQRVNNLSAASIIKNAGLPKRAPSLIATHKARFLEADSPPGLSLGVGPFVTALEESSGVSAYVVGKPTIEFFKNVINDFAPEEVGQDRNTSGRIAIIGDDIEADLGEGALQLNLWRVLVRTGKYRPGDESRCGTTPPDEVVDTFADFVNLLLDQQSAKF